MGRRRDRSYVIAARARIFEKTISCGSDDVEWMRRVFLQAQSLALHEMHQDLTQQPNHKASLAALSAKPIIGKEEYRLTHLVHKAAGLQRHDIPVHPKRWRPKAFTLRADAPEFEPAKEDAQCESVLSYLLQGDKDKGKVDFPPMPIGYPPAHVLESFWHSKARHIDCDDVNDGAPCNVFPCLTVLPCRPRSDALLLLTSGRWLRTCGGKLPIYRRSSPR